MSDLLRTRILETLSPSGIGSRRSLVSLESETKAHPVWRASSAFGSCDVPQVRVSLREGSVGALSACGCPPAGRLRALATIFMNSPGEDPRGLAPPSVRPIAAADELSDTGRREVVGVAACVHQSSPPSS